VVRRITRLFGDASIHLAFKKLVVQRLAAFFYTDLLARRVAQTLGGQPMLIAASAVTVYEDGWWRRLLPPAVASSPSCRFARWQLTAGRLRVVVEAIGAKWTTAYGMAGCIVRTVRRWRPAPPRRRYRVGVTVINTLRQLANDVRGIDFLVDGRDIRREDVAIVSPRRSTPEEARKFSALGLAVCVAERVLDPAPLARVLGQGLRLLADGHGPRWLRTGAWYVVEDHGLWSTFAARHHIDVLVTHADHGFRHVARNVVLRQAGTRTCYYIDSWNYNNLYATPTGRPYRHWLWTYLLYDVLVAWNRVIVEYFQAHAQRIGAYVAVGCPWAEHARLLREGALRSEAAERVRAALTPGQRLVAVFPAWYQDLSVIPPEDGLAFVEDIHRLLEDFPDVVIVVKEKQPRWFFVRHERRDVARTYGGVAGARIYAAYDRMEAESRCLFPGHAMSASELIAVADLVISDPFTSTTYEALAAGVKALYHDASGRHRGALYDRIPGLVTHGYASLAARVRELLDDTPPADYAAYLKQHFVGALEPDLEALALTRFRALLAGRAPADVGAWCESS
jgi:hypothetical protein